MILTRIGQHAPGGRFVGINRIGNSCHMVIVSPKWTEEIKGFRLKTVYTHTPNTESPCNGLANTRAMDSSEHPAARFCLDLVVNGFNDYYLPSLNELELCYRNFKPNTRRNVTHPASLVHFVTRINNSAIPPGRAYTTVNPCQTVVTAFCEGNSEAFERVRYWSSTDHSLNTGWSFNQNFVNGIRYRNIKTFSFNVRAVRRILIL